MNAEQQNQFDCMIGRLDRILSEVMGYAKSHKTEPLDEANLQTLKHHIEDMELLAAAVRKKMNLPSNSQTPQTEKTTVTLQNVNIEAMEKLLTGNTKQEQPEAPESNGLEEYVAAVGDFAVELFKQLTDKNKNSTRGIILETVFNTCNFVLGRREWIQRTDITKEAMQNKA